MNNIKISVIIPIYNAQTYLKKCLDSIINQTLNEIEILCVDHGSTDKSLNILNEYFLKDSRIHILHCNHKNRGAGAPRNVGLNNAKGKYIHFIDPDDWIVEDAYEKLYDFAENHDSDLVLFKALSYREWKNDTFKDFSFDYGCLDETYNDIVFNMEKLQSNVFNLNGASWNKLIKRQFIDSINARFPEGIFSQDHAFSFQLYLNAKRICILREYLYYYRKHDESVTWTTGKKQFDIIKARNVVIDVFKKFDYFEKFKVEVINQKIEILDKLYRKMEGKYIEELFSEIKKDFENMKVTEKISSDFLKKLNVKNKVFFLAILKSNNATDFRIKEYEILSYNINTLKKQNSKLICENNEIKLSEDINKDYLYHLEYMIDPYHSNFQKMDIDEKINKLKSINVNPDNSLDLEKFLSLPSTKNSDEVLFGSSKITLPKKFKNEVIDSNSICLKNELQNIFLEEFDVFFNPYGTLEEIYSNYLNEQEYLVINEDSLKIGKSDVNRIFRHDSNKFIIDYWFIKFGKIYHYQASVDISIIDDYVKKEVTSEILDNEIKISNNYKLTLSSFGESDINTILLKYFEDKSNFNLIKNSFVVNNMIIERTILIDGFKFFINYWFVNQEKSYRYNIHFKISNLDTIVKELIDSTSPGSLNLGKFYAYKFLNDLEFNLLSANNISRILKAFNNKISIIIPIYNAYEDTKRCIESVFENTDLLFDLYLIDDCSTDERISGLLDEYECYDNVYIIRNEFNKGFTRNVNKGMELTDTDVILLNSDTIVTPNWDKKFVFAAYYDDRIATVTPISNASDISIPDMNKNNVIPNGFDVNSFSRFVENVSLNGNIQCPTGNGFCLFIKRAVLDDIGLFDENAFGKGYGEETDFTMRAHKNGWKNVRNDSIFIYHKRSASFSLETADKLKDSHKLVLQTRHPTVFKEWRHFAQSINLKNSLSFIKFSLNHFNNSLIKNNILYITDLKDNMPLVDDLDKISKNFNVFCLTLEDSFLKLWAYDRNRFIFINELKFNKTVPNINELNLWYAKLFNCFKIDLVFLRFSHTFKMIHSQEITPLIFASKIKIPILYGRCSNDLFNQLPLKKSSLPKINFKKEKGVVYTAIFGRYESLLDPVHKDKNLDYICFTDNPFLKSDVWEIRYVDYLDLDDTRKARTIKILPHKFLNEYDFSIWVDGGFQIIGDLEEYVNTYSKEGLLLGIDHSWRDCIYEEAKAVLSFKKDDSDVVTSQMDKYRFEGFPENYGLIESGVLFRRHNDKKVIDLMEDWYDEVLNSSKRDQLSFNYICWKNNFEYDHVPIFYWKNHYFEHFNHLNSAYDNKLLNKKLRIIFVANDDVEKTKQSLYSINNNIPISILSYYDYSNFVGYNIDFHFLDNQSNVISEINRVCHGIHEDFVYFMYSGDIMQYPLINNLFHLFNKVDNNSIGAIIFDDSFLIDGHIFLKVKPNFSFEKYSKHDFIKNKAIVNRKVLMKEGGFDIHIKSFVNDFILRISEDYKIINCNEVTLEKM